MKNGGSTTNRACVSQEFRIGAGARGTCFHLCCAGVSGLLSRIPAGEISPRKGRGRAVKALPAIVALNNR